jgi:hypothetical protein
VFPLAPAPVAAVLFDLRFGDPTNHDRLAMANAGAKIIATIPSP